MRARGLVFGIFLAVCFTALASCSKGGWWEDYDHRAVSSEFGISPALHKLLKNCGLSDKDGEFLTKRLRLSFRPPFQVQVNDEDVIFARAKGNDAMIVIGGPAVAPRGGIEPRNYYRYDVITARQRSGETRPDLGSNPDSNNVATVLASYDLQHTRLIAKIRVNEFVQGVFEFECERKSS